MMLWIFCKENPGHVRFDGVHTLAAILINLCIAECSNFGMERCGLRGGFLCVLMDHRSLANLVKSPHLSLLLYSLVVSRPTFEC